MKLKDAVNMEEGVRKAASLLNDVMSEACRMGLDVKVEIHESEYMIGAKRAVRVSTKCLANPKDLEV